MPSPLRVTIVVGDGYIPDLMQRMAEDGITAVELAKESGFSKQELSRWFNQRVGSPSMANVAKIERALVNLRRRKMKTPSRGSLTVRARISFDR